MVWRIFGMWRTGGCSLPWCIAHKKNLHQREVNWIGGKYRMDSEAFPNRLDTMIDKHPRPDRMGGEPQYGEATF